jgi:predicted metal-dependent phosphoesterase TrpH
MTSRIFTASDNLDWKKAYMAAVTEKDRCRLPELIHEAREKLSQRLHELWTVRPLPSEEVEAIHDALYLLEALMSSLLYRAETGEWDRADQDY